MTDRILKARLSKNGSTSQNWRELQLPQLGEYDRRTQPLNRAGVARAWMVETEVTSPLVVDIMGAVAAYDELGA